MPRRVEDIIRSDKRSIKSIPKEPLRRGAVREKVIQASEAEEEVPIHIIKMSPKEIVTEKELAKNPSPTNKKPKKKSAGKFWLFLAIALVAIVIGAGYVSSIYFSRAKFTIKPIIIPVNVANTTVVATATSTPGYLRYEVLPYTAMASTTLPATDGPYISTKANGTITIYNSFSNTPQRLIAGTRFVSNDGKIYRLTSSVSVPGYTSAKGITTPGTLKAIITADEAGEEYNLVRTGMNDELKIPAYKGAPRYDTVYGRLSTNLTGGFVGTRKTVDLAALASTTKEIQSVLITRMLSEAKNKLPSSYITYPGSYTVTFLPAVVGGNSKNIASVSVMGTLYSVVFRKVDLVTKLAGQAKMATLANSAYDTFGLEDLQFTITNPSNFNPAKSTALIVRLNGDMRITGIVPVEELRSKLAGLSLKDTKNVLMSYSSVIDVAKSSGELFPSWANVVPKDQSRISIVLED